jgi:RNase adapter protein RapZ
VTREKRHAARRAARTAVSSRFVVLTGLSGSGKSQAVRALEDLGYFCVDNLPVMLLPTLAELTLRAGSEIARAAVVVDVREGRLLEEFPGIYRKLKAMRGLDPVLIFLDATEAALVRRFSETRRPHPLAPDRSALEGIREERRAMAPIRRMADHIIDTTEMTVHELRHVFTGVASGRTPGAQLVVTILSFGFKHGIPVDSDLLFDVRFLPNPHFVPELRPHTGRDPQVIAYLDRATATHQFLEHVLNLLKFLVPQYVTEGKAYLTIGIGCTGGRHRSVAIAEALRKGLAGLPNVRARVKHRDIAHEQDAGRGERAKSKGPRARGKGERAKGKGQRDKRLGMS